jgi:hypothetical protein
MAKTTKLAFGYLLLVVCLGCVREGAIWLERGSDAKHLVFGLSLDEADKNSPAIVDGFSVGEYECRGGRSSAKIIWSLESLHPHQENTVLGKITYGIVPAGYKASEALPISSGCYIARYGGDGYIANVAFVITSDGAALQLR